MNDDATFELAKRIRSDEGATIGDVFSFLSGLYFRGKVAYARAFARPSRGMVGASVITSNRGLLPLTTRISVAELRDFGMVDIDAEDPRYREPLEKDAQAMQRRIGPHCEVVLLGSVATPKYVDALLQVFGERLRFPAEFAGRGDMSRGGLMLRCVEEVRELTYVKIQDAARRGKRPPKLERRVMKSKD